MEFFKRPTLWLVPLILPALFAVDKVFLLPSVRDRFIQPGGMMYYRQRQEQLGLLAKHVATIGRAADQTVIVLGDSRSFGLGRHSAIYAGFEKPDIWNFAGPQAVPAYHDYLLEKILAMPNAPSRFVIGLSPDGMTRNAGIFGMPVLTYGVDAEWIERNRRMIPAQDYEVYVSSRRYALKGMQFSFGTLFSRLHASMTQPDLATSLARVGLRKEQVKPEQLQIVQQLMTVRREDLSYYSYEHSPHRMILNATGGAQLAWIGRMSDADLKRETDELVSLYLRHFVVSQEQLFFLERALRRIHQAGGRAVLFWPAVNPYLRRVYAEEPAIARIWVEAQGLADRYKAKTVNFNEPGRLACEDYYDASHLSVTCFPAITDTLLRIILEKRPEHRMGEVIPTP